MASYGTKKGLAKAMGECDRQPLRRYLRELVIEDGPRKTAGLLEKMSACNAAIGAPGLEMAKAILETETRANLGILRRKFPDTWHAR